MPPFPSTADPVTYSIDTKTKATRSMRQRWDFISLSLPLHFPDSQFGVVCEMQKFSSARRKVRPPPVLLYPLFNYNDERDLPRIPPPPPPFPVSQGPFIRQILSCKSGWLLCGYWSSGTAKFRGFHGAGGRRRGTVGRGVVAEGLRRDAGVVRIPLLGAASCARVLEFPATHAHAHVHACARAGAARLSIGPPGCARAPARYRRRQKRFAPRLRPETAQWRPATFWPDGVVGGFGVMAREHVMSYLRKQRAAVTERLDCSLPTNVYQVQSPAGSLPDFRK
ncbi:hypothetical protein PR048_017050 [Dryococelus australis]|uniref:Uncharacterized protein n=1 Tax=Dryococelus australis TaxID=614101 RepID=A0ABQ9H8G8_9NEOP|nr:hypothetical protein PR048_017050 [Dryococelus australis]